MIKSSKKKYRNLQVTHRPEKKQIGTRELVLTLSVPDDEVIKVEMVEKSGQRRELSEEQFAELVGENDGEDISPEEAYAAGITDVTEDEFELDDEGGGEDEEIERFVLRKLVARQLLRRGVRRLILRRLRRRESIRRARPGVNAVREAAGKGPQKKGQQGGALHRRTQSSSA
jgi:hypothetical protein